MTLLVVVISMVVVAAGMLLSLAILVLPPARERLLDTMQHTRDTRSIMKNIPPTVPPYIAPKLPIIMWHKISGSNVHYLLVILIPVYSSSVLVVGVPLGPEYACKSR